MWKLVWQLVLIITIVLFIFMFFKFTVTGYKELKEIRRDNTKLRQWSCIYS